MDRYVLSCLLFLGPLLVAQPAVGQTITEINRLSFGTFAIARNDTPKAIRVTPDNDVFVDDGIIGGDGARRAEYLLQDFPPNVSFFLGVDVPNPPAEGGIVIGNQTACTLGAGPAFYLENLSIANGGVLQTDGDGDATLYIGATLRTSGDNRRYDGGTYLGSFDFVIYY